MGGPVKSSPTPEAHGAMAWKSPSLRQQSVSTSPAVDLAPQPLAHDDVRTLMNTAKSLRHLGIEASDLPIPKICVVGDQSTGKSSVIESISEIRTPRSSGTCTRCPIEINLSDDAAGGVWRCEVYLTIKYTYDSKAKKVATRNNPLGPWIETETQTVHFASLNSKEEVLHALKCAQTAILNPTKPTEPFKPHNNPTTDSFMVPFSPNVVRVDIFGPALLNLSFYDLPGVVSQDSNEYVPKLISNLVKEYIKPDNCIILQTLTMNHDAANSNAASIIKESKAVSRTVGVLTKPDLFISDSLYEWQDILDGKKFALDLGYYVVKNNPNPEVEHAVARREEEQFFSSQEPFNTHLAPHQERFGTKRLLKALSKMLAAEIKKSLPKIIQCIEIKLLEIDSELSGLPRPLEGNVSLQISHKIMDFAASMSKELDGGSLDCSFFETWRSAAQHFRNHLVCSHPLLLFGRPTLMQAIPSRTPQRALNPHQNAEQSPTPAPRTVEPIQIPSDDEDESQSSGSKRARNSDNSPAKRRAMEAALPPTPKPALIEQLSKLAGSQQAKQHSKRFTIGDVTTYLNKLHTGLPSARNQQITERIYFESVGHWKRLTDELLQTTSQLCEDLALLCMVNTFAQWSSTRLHRRISEIIDKFHTDAITAQYESIDGLHMLEKTKVMTFDSYDMEGYERDIRSVLLEQSLRWRFNLYGGQLPRIDDKKSEDKAVAALRAWGVDHPEPHGPEIREMATARAYYHCAARRFADYVALDICVRLFTKIKRDLPEALREGLGLNAEDANERCKKLLAVPDEVQRRRERLEHERESLRKGQRTLRSLQVSGTRVGLRLGPESDDLMEL